VPYDKNPRKISSKEKRELEERLSKFGLIGLPSMDADGTLIGGHQRLKSMLLMGWGEKEIDVRVASRKLTEEEFAQVLLIDNEHSATWDIEALQRDFSDLVDLESFGFAFEDIAGNEKTAMIEPEYPIVPKMS
jgi:ParB-like chromosome segregation protein Spo0J